MGDPSPAPAVAASARAEDIEVLEPADALPMAAEDVSARAREPAPGEGGSWAGGAEEPLSSQGC